MANPFLARKERPLVVGHRGVPKLHQENTLAGFRRAAELGVPAIELDARLTKDHRAVVFHDIDLFRMTGTPRNVNELTWDELSRLRIRREVPMGTDANGAPVMAVYDRVERIPLLSEVLAECRLAINVELKLDVPRWWPVDVGSVVARDIAEAKAEERVIVTSFDPRKLRAAWRARPSLATGFCFDDSMLNFASGLLDWLPVPGKLAATAPADRRPHRNARRLLNWLLDSRWLMRLLGSRVVGAEHTLVERDAVDELHRRGVAIGTHTLFPMGSTTGKAVSELASSAAEVARLVETGIDWIETDDAERLLALVA